MFDTHVYRAPDVNVRVNQLPHDTADAARLYGEMVQMAREEVSKAVLNEFGAHNELRLIEVAAHQSMESLIHKTRVIFSLNGEKYDLIVDNLESCETRRAFLEVIANSVANEVFKKLAARLPSQASPKVLAWES